MKIDIRLDGVETVIKKMQFMKDKSSLSIGRSMVRAALNVTGKQIKADLDPKVKRGRKAVKARFKKGKFRIEAKVGFGVGPRNKKAYTQRARSKSRPGVGIGPNNVHWWVAGTKKRTTDFKRSNRGVMPSMQPGLAKIAYAKSAGKIKAEIIKRGALQLQKEIDKLQKVK